MRAVGRSVPRLDGREKVRGAALYVDDLAFPGMLHARTIRSTVARGVLLGARLLGARKGFTVVDHRAIPGDNVVALIEDDQPLLVEREIRHFGEPILLLAHADPERLREARVEVSERALPPRFDAEASDRVCKRIEIAKGDLARGFAEADVVVEGEYRTGHQEQLAIETQGVIAVPERRGITVHGSLQCPHYVHRALVRCLGLAPERVRVVQAETGGGFGGKEEFPSMVAGHAALLALAARRPVKLVYDRMEDMEATTKRHPSRVRHRTGVRRDGRITAMEIDVLLDGGAYVTLSPVVLSRGVLHATGPYRCDHVRIVGRAVLTDTPPNGAFRGFGAPQTQFAMEAHVDRIAEALGMDPLRLRERNALRAGDTTATGQRLGRDCSALAVLRDAARRTRFRARRRSEPRSVGGRRRGLGLALFFHGSGFTGEGEVRLASRASLELTPRGARVLVGSTEIGQGTRTMHAQIVADTLGVDLGDVEVAVADTDRVPDSGPTVASRTCMVVGRILQRCAEEMRARLGGLTPRAYLRRYGPLVITKAYEPPEGVRFDESTYRGDAYGAFGFGCDVVEVELDPDTFEARPVRATCVVDVGRAIHPIQVAGQIEGGTSQGLAFASLEEVVMRGGRMANAQLTNYGVPTVADTPVIEAVIREHGYRRGPFGAKGVGEMPIDGPAPAFVNALRHLGLDVRAIPATPERIQEAAEGAAREAPCDSR